MEFLSSNADYYQHLYYINQPGQLANSDRDPDAAKVGEFHTFPAGAALIATSSGRGDRRCGLHVGRQFFSRQR
jgi:hypothetical protein